MTHGVKFPRVSMCQVSRGNLYTYFIPNVSFILVEELCYNRWKKLRDRFAREYRNHQINQSAPITWRYFNDLMFLGRHFRKGVPLVIENIKKRGRPRKISHCQVEQAGSTVTAGLSAAAGEHIWGGDYPYSTDNDNDDLEEDELTYDDPDDIEVVSDVEQELIQMDMAPIEEEQLQLGQPQEQFLEPAESLDVTTTVPAMHDQQQQQQQLLQLTVEQGHHLSADSSALMVGLADIVQPNAAATNAEKLFGTVISNMETVLQQSKDCLHLMQHAATTTPPALTNNSLLSKVQMLLDGLGAEQRRQAERKILHFLCECQIKTLDGQEIEDVAPCHIYSVTEL